MFGDANLGRSLVKQRVFIVKPELLGIPFPFIARDVKIIGCGVPEVSEIARIRIITFEGIAAQIMLEFGERGFEAAAFFTPMTNACFLFVAGKGPRK